MSGMKDFEVIEDLKWWQRSLQVPRKAKDSDQSTITGVWELHLCLTNWAHTTQALQCIRVFIETYYIMFLLELHPCAMQVWCPDESRQEHPGDAIRLFEPTRLSEGAYRKP